ncbi:MAG: glycosyltransferase family 4 protein [Bacteroidales bacterium]|nr:glycosyltransferase family 4 protein [Bacteroidales bacterium]
MSEIKLTHINSYYITSRLHGELVSMLDKKGLKQHVFVPVQKTAHLNKNMPEKLKHGEIYYTHCFSTFHRYLWPLKMMRTWKAFKKHYAKHSTELIHAHSLIVNGLIAYRAHKKWKLPYIVSIRSTDMHIFMQKSFIFRNIGYRILKNASAIMFLSPAYLDIQLKAILGDQIYRELKPKSHIIPNGINDYWLNNRKSKERANNQRTVIFVGIINKRKNLQAIINACEILNKQSFNIRLMVAGDGPLLSDLKKQKHLTPVSYYGHISDPEKLRDLYREADLLAVPSLIETFGLIYPEAMSQGLPVIYSKNQGFDGHFPEGYVGFTVNPHDANEIASKIKMIYSYYARLSNNAYEASLTFSWEMVAEKLINLYSSIKKVN